MSTQCIGLTCLFLTKSVAVHSPFYVLNKWVICPVDCPPSRIWLLISSSVDSRFSLPHISCKFVVTWRGLITFRFSSFQVVLHNIGLSRFQWLISGFIGISLIYPITLLQNGFSNCVTRSPRPPLGWFTRQTHRTQKNCYSYHLLQWKSAKGKAHGRSPGDSLHKLLVVLSANLVSLMLWHLCLADPGETAPPRDSQFLGIKTHLWAHLLYVYQPIQSPYPNHLLSGALTFWATIHLPSSHQGQAPENQGQSLCLQSLLKLVKPANPKPVYLACPVPSPSQ